MEYIFKSKLIFYGQGDINKSKKLKHLPIIACERSETTQNNALLSILDCPLLSQ